jgi:hypothetical protein
MAAGRVTGRSRPGLVDSPCVWSGTWQPMPNFFWQSPRLSYAQIVLPIFRMLVVGGVLVMLALLTGFVAPAPTSPARPVAPARGPLIEATEHPEWRQFLVQAAYRRAGEIDRLRELPDIPTIMPAPPVEESKPVVAAPEQLAKLPPTQTDSTAADVTGSVEDAPGGVMAIDIGEASATELPLKDQELHPPVQRPESLKPLIEGRRNSPPPRHAKLRAKPSAQPQMQPDFFTTLFGSARSDNTASAQRR